MDKEQTTLAASEEVIRAVLANGETFSFKPYGTSMLPTIRAGRDSVSIVRLDGRAQLYDILLYKRPTGKFVLHRVIAVGEEDYTLVGDNRVQIEHGVKDEWIIGVLQTIHYPNGKELTRGTKAFYRAGRRAHRRYPLRRLRMAISSRLGRIFPKQRRNNDD
jgi:hypothetical protein